MRNAMICVSIMLTLFLVWPVVFGGGDNLYRAIAAPTPQRVVAPLASEARLIKTEVRKISSPRPLVVEGCRTRYERAYAACPMNNGTTCRQRVADRWDLCEATGFWPDA